MDRFINPTVSTTSISVATAPLLVWEVQSPHTLLHADTLIVVWQLVVLGWIVLPLVIVYPIAKWVRSNWALHWRMCLMRSYMEAWDPNAPQRVGSVFWPLL